ncbi:unnamed protein product [Euphydryas editha]|uniref:Uncharacterized protein n=1 Tax=Euphydryas editha TaxID=104508 RepID=A0AAU9TDJ6_EUPED|nr:unnamed protein product [Euphydryas editha]
MFKVFVIFCIVIKVHCFSYKSDSCDGCEYTRIKRAKYFSNAPFKFYNRPPYSPPIKGPFSYTPPPGYTANDVGPPTPSNLRPFKSGKKDLDKIVEYANERNRYTDRYKEESDKHNYNPPDFSNTDNIYHIDQMYDSKRIFNSPNKQAYENKHYNSDDGPNSEYFTNKQSKGSLQNYQAYSQGSVQTSDIKDERQFSFLDAYIQKEISGISQNNNYFNTDSSTMQEEVLPKPINLRTNDPDVSYTNDVVSVVKPATSYKLENFAELPLMEYENSKLHKVNSYSVPHYSVTSTDYQPMKQSFSSPFSLSSQLLNPSNIKIPEVEPAPPASAAKEQSDAHLKAIKIWTHKSKGTAYTLHDDGTLTLEKPWRP